MSITPSVALLGVTENCIKELGLRKKQFKGGVLVGPFGVSLVFLALCPEKTGIIDRRQQRDKGGRAGQ